MKIKTAPLSKFVKINPDGITKGYPYQTIEYIDISSVGSGHFIESPKELLLKVAPSRAKRIVKDKDIILGTVRPNLRSFLFMRIPSENTIVSTGFAVLRAKDSSDPRFIYYAITNRNFTEYLTNNTKGTSYPAVDSDTVLRGEIPDLDFKQQQYIGNILSAYDDLIDNNRKRIQLLEESARLLFREWFVYFRFPLRLRSGQAGHEKVHPIRKSNSNGVKIVDDVPEGWKRGKVKDLGVIVTGKTPSTKNVSNFNGAIPFIKTPDMHKSPIIINTEESLSETGANSQKNKYLPPRSILVSCIGTVGIVAMNWLRAQTNQQINSIIPKKEIYRYYSFFYLSRLKPLLEAIGGGSTMANINKNKFEGLDVFIPPGTILESFDGIVDPVFNQIAFLLQQNQKLAQARDLLLPRLMSGAIDPIRYDKLSNGAEV